MVVLSIKDFTFGWRRFLNFLLPFSSEINAAFLKIANLSGLWTKRRVMVSRFLITKGFQAPPCFLVFFHLGGMLFCNFKYATYRSLVCRISDCEKFLHNKPFSFSKNIFKFIFLSLFLFYSLLFGPSDR